MSTEGLVAAAGVTRGALYHHFRDKHDLFREVYIQLELEISEEFLQRIDDTSSAIEVLQRGVEWFLNMCERPDVRQIALHDAPAVLGWAQWRKIEADHALGVLTEQLEEVARHGTNLPGPPHVVAALLFSIMIEAALRIAHADDPAAERSEVEQILYFIAARALGL